MKKVTAHVVRKANEPMLKLIRKLEFEIEYYETWLERCRLSDTDMGYCYIKGARDKTESLLMYIRDELKSGYEMGLEKARSE